MHERYPAKLRSDDEFEAPKQFVESASVYLTNGASFRSRQFVLLPAVNSQRLLLVLNLVAELLARHALRPICSMTQPKGNKVVGYRDIAHLAEAENAAILR